MSYLNFNHLENSRIYNESLATMGRQFIDDFAQLFDLDSWTSTRKGNEKFLGNKRAYFDSLYKIDGELKRKLTGWIKRIPNVFYLPEEKMKQFLNTLDQHQEVHGYHDKNGGGTTTYTISQTKALILQQKARETNNKNSFTNATCIYPFKIDNKVCIVFFTFDNNEIYTAQIATTNQYAKSMTSSGFDIVEIPEWDNVNVREYIK